jgi:hypothetical protein
MLSKLFKNQQQACLQALGIDLYIGVDRVDSLDVPALPWLHNVCTLLDIKLDDCLFDSPQPYFDTSTKRLHLPKTYEGSENAFKKAVWHSIQQWVVS